MCNIIRTMLAIAILSFGLCFTGCSDDTEYEPTEAVKTEAEKQQVQHEPDSCFYYVNAKVSYTEEFPEGTTVVCKDESGMHYAFIGEGYCAGDSVKLIINDYGTEDTIDDVIENAKII